MKREQKYQEILDSYNIKYRMGAIEKVEESIKQLDHVFDEFFADTFDYQISDCKDEPQISCCETCKHNGDTWDSEACDPCSRANNNYEPQTEK